MYRESFNGLANTKLQNEIKNINKAIDEEKKQNVRDSHRIARLEEQKLLQGMFSNDFGTTYGKYRNPW